jgi:hypothetical protein
MLVGVAIIGPGMVDRQAWASIGSLCGHSRMQGRPYCERGKIKAEPEQVCLVQRRIMILSDSRLLTCCCWMEISTK